MEIIRDIPQGSDEWFALRIGSLGGSSISKAVAKGEGKTRKQLLYDMVGEILANQKKEHFKSKPMEDGITFEDDARNLYVFKKDCEVDQISMFKDGPHKHYSPDGVIGDTGLLEIKCVIPSTYVEAKITGVVPTDYRRQIQWGLAVSEMEWCDYVVYCPAIGELIIQRLVRDEKEIQILKAGADDFITDMLRMYKAVLGDPGNMLSPEQENMDDIPI